MGDTMKSLSDQHFNEAENGATSTMTGSTLARFPA